MGDLISDDKVSIGKKPALGHRKSFSFPQDNFKFQFSEIPEKLESVDNVSCSKLGVLANLVIKTISLTTFVIFLIISMYIFRDYLNVILVWAEQEPMWVVIIVFTLLFTLVSLPFAWGYIIVNMAAGYLFGAMYGFVLTLVTATLGVLFAHIFIKLFLSSYVKRMLGTSEYSRAFLAVISSTQVARIVILSRLTPVPFGLQNAIFSVSSIPISKYLVFSMVGLFPSQLINAYIGSTLRSMEEVLSSETNENTWMAGWILLASQLSMSILVGIVILNRAKLELNKAVAESQIETA